jgi:hypothetical protein
LNPHQPLRLEEISQTGINTKCNSHNRIQRSRINHTKTLNYAMFGYWENVMGEEKKSKIKQNLRENNISITTQSLKKKD